MEQLVVWSYEHYRWLFGNKLKYNSSSNSSSTHVVVGVVNVLGDGGGGYCFNITTKLFFLPPNFYLLKKYKTQIRYMNNLPNDKTNKMKVNSSYVINNDPLRQPQQAEIFPSLVGTDRPANTMSRCHKCSHMVVSIWEISFISFFVSVSGTFLIFRMGTFQVCSKSLMSLCVISL